jgi:hypothetical protein
MHEVGPSNYRMQIGAGQKIAEIFLASEMTFPLQIALHGPDMRDLTDIRAVSERSAGRNLSGLPTGPELAFRGCF